MLGVLTNESMSEIFSDIQSYDEVQETETNEEVLVSSEVSRFIEFLSETECKNLDKYSFSEIFRWLNGLTDKTNQLAVDGRRTVYDSIHRDFLKIRNKRRVLL